MQKKINVPKLPYISWSLIVTIFLVGLVCLLVKKYILTDGIYAVILEILGSFLIISVPIEVLKEVFFEEENKKSFANEVSKIFDEKIDAELIKARIFGLARIEGTLDFNVLFNDLKSGETLWWLDTFCPAYKTWIGSTKEAIKRGVFIKLLVLDPSSQLAEMRAKEIGYKNFVKELDLFISEFEYCQTNCENGSKLEIIKYNDLLGVPCYVVTKEDKPIRGFSSMYLLKATGEGFPHFFWHQGPMCEYLFKYIKNKYDSNK